MDLGDRTPRSFQEEPQLGRESFWLNSVRKGSNAEVLHAQQELPVLDRRHQIPIGVFTSAEVPLSPR